MIDILKIASTCKLYNFHTHTQFCDGHACMEDFVTAAIATHFSHLGFTPHSPIPFSTSLSSPDTLLILISTIFGSKALPE